MNAISWFIAAFIIAVAMMLTRIGVMVGSTLLAFVGGAIAGIGLCLVAAIVTARLED